MNARPALFVIPLLLALPLAAQELPVPARSLRVTGQLILPASARPGDPVEIVARHAGAGGRLSGGVIACARPDATGRFRLELDAPESGFLLELDARWLELRPLWIEPRRGERTLDVVLAPGLRGILRGRFVASGDAPLAAERLAGSWVWIDGGELQLAEVDHEGQFELAGPADCFRGPLVACPHDFAPIFVDAPVVQDGELSELALPLIPCASVRGIVVGADGCGIAGITLSLARGHELREPLPQDPWGGLRTVTTTAKGDFEAGGLPPGDLALRVVDPRWRVRDAQIAALLPGEARADVRVELVRASSLRGIVADERGQPVAGARVTAGARSGLGGVLVTTTNASGQYTFDSVTPGDYVIGARFEGQAARSAGVVSVAEGRRRETDLVLGRASELRLWLRDHPAPVFVRIADPAGFLRAEQRVWHGELALTLPPGRYQVSLVTREGVLLERELPLTGREGAPVLLRM